MTLQDISQKDVKFTFLLLGEAVASKAVFVIVSGSDGWVETLFKPAKLLKKQ